VLMSWCRFNILTPVIFSIIASMNGRAASIRWVRTSLSRSFPLSARDLTGFFPLQSKRRTSGP
jgi:hypothetical protein